jgi:phytanoyl-CoA dioxygenase PhyH
VALAPDIPAQLDARLLERATQELTGGLTFLIDGDAVTYTTTGASVQVTEDRADGATVVRLSRHAWDDLVAQVRTFVGLFLGNELTFERGGFEQLADWDPVLKYLHAGIPPYAPTAADFAGRSPTASFPADTDDAELAAQLATMGVLHVTGVFSAEEMAAVNAEVDRLAALAQPDDDESWWASTDDGSRVLCRLVYAGQRSPLLAELEQDPRVRRFGTLLDPDLRVASDRMEGSAVLLKAPGKTSGLSNIPWHQDCGVGGHGLFCPSVGVGIQLAPETCSSSPAAKARHFRIDGRTGSTTCRS